MTLEACLLILLMSTFYLTSLVGIDSLCEDVAELASPLVNQTLLVSDCVSPPTSTLTKAVYAIWVWAIYFTFPGRTSLHSPIPAHPLSLSCLSSAPRNLLHPAGCDRADVWPQVRRLHLCLPVQWGHHQQPHHRPDEPGRHNHYHQLPNQRLLRD